MPKNAPDHLVTEQDLVRKPDPCVGEFEKILRRQADESLKTKPERMVLERLNDSLRQL